MPLRVVLLHIGERDQANCSIIQQMRSTAEKEIVPGLTASISDATESTTEGSKPVIPIDSDNVAGAIIMYDTTRRETFLGCGAWISTFKASACKEAVVILLADKSFENSPRKRVVSEQEGKLFAEAYGAELYYEVDSVNPYLAKMALTELLTAIDEAGKHPKPSPPKSRRHTTTCSTPTSTVNRALSEDSATREMKEELELERAKLESLKLEVEKKSALKQELASAKMKIDKLNSDKNALQQMHSIEKQSLEQRLEEREDEVKQRNASLQQSNARLQQLDEYCSSLEQEKQALQEALTLQASGHAEIQSQLQQEIQQEVRVHSETQKELREMELALRQAQGEICLLRQSKTLADRWKISRNDVTINEAERLGHGAWGYVAKGEFCGKKVAVKCLHEEIMAGETIQRVHREISTMASIRHPNIVLFVAAVLDNDGPPLIVCEIMDTNLRGAYEEKVLKGMGAKMEILHGVACALNYLHKLQEPIIHRDISSPNVLLKAAGVDKWIPKLSDFGSANRAQCSRTLAEGAIIYAAPETYPESNPQPQTTKIDVYSFGVLTREIVTEELPNPCTLSSTYAGVLTQWPLLHQLIVASTNSSPPHRPDMETVIAAFLNPLLERTALSFPPTSFSNATHHSLPPYLSHQNYHVPAV